MKKTCTTLGLALSLGLTLSASAWAQMPDHRTCGSMDVLARQQAENPDLAARMQEVETHTARVLEARKAGRVETVNVTIPVIVHVVYNTAAQNISDAQINSQMAVLNADYAALNADYANVPSLFSGIKSGSGIQFCLAKTDPNGNPTTGIERVSTTKTSFSSNDGVKKSTTGGANAWDASKYLNIWVCNLGGGLLGYAQFPGGAAATDGVVILYSAFGVTGSANAPYNLGRSATHEVGHWLNLRHIWGDATCGNDLVNDTPTQNTSNFGCPSFPHSTCSNTSDMFMNYMDYTDDACMFTFSAGQVARMEALFAAGGARASLLTSAMCGTVTPPACGTPSGLGATSITQTGATLAWSALSGATSYNLQWKAASASTWTTVSTTSTSYALSGLTASTGYNFQVQAICASGAGAYSAASSFTTTGTTTVTYCANAGGSTADEWIASFALGSISNASTGLNSPGYQDFTSLSTNLLPGSSYTATYKTGYRSPVYTEYYRMWIDYNRDGDFLDAGETVFSRSSSSTGNLTSTFTVPAGATLGKTRLRISMKYGAYLGAACTSYGTGWGQVEDYTVILGSGTGREAASTSFTLETAPNPASEMSIIQAALPEGATTATVRILDLQGRMLWQAADVAAPNGYLRDYGVNVRDLKAGIYLLQVESAGMRKQVRLAVE